MPSPTYQAIGTAQVSTAAITVAWPAHATDDIGLLCLVTRADQAPTLSTPSGFAAVTSGNVSAPGSTSTSPQLNLYWCRATSAAMADVVTSDSGMYQQGVIITCRGCIASGYPVNAIGTLSSGSTITIPMPAAVSTVVDTIVVGVAIARLATAAAWVSASPSYSADPGTLTERYDFGSTIAASLWIGTAPHAAAATTGTGAGTCTNSVQASITLALIPAAAAGIVRHMMQYHS